MKQRLVLKLAMVMVFSRPYATAKYRIRDMVVYSPPVSRFCLGTSGKSAPRLSTALLAKATVFIGLRWIHTSGVILG